MDETHNELEMDIIIKGIFSTALLMRKSSILQDKRKSSIIQNRTRLEKVEILRSNIKEIQTRVPPFQHHLSIAWWQPQFQKELQPIIE